MNGKDNTGAVETEVLQAYRNRATSSLPSIAIRTLDKERLADKEGFLTLQGDQVVYRIEGIAKKEVLSIPRIDQLLTVAITDFTTKNNKKTQKLDLECVIDLPWWLKQKGIDPNNKNAVYNEVKKIRRDLKKARGVVVNLVPDVQSKKNIEYTDLSIIGTHEVKRGKIIVYLDQKFANNLAQTNTLTQYPVALLRLDSKDEVAYALGKKLWEYWHIKKNQKEGRQDLISVKSLIDALPITKMNTLIATRHAHLWCERIKEPLDEAFIKLLPSDEGIGVIKSYKYLVKVSKLGDREEKYRELTDHEEQYKRATDYDFFENLFIQFDIEGIDLLEKPKK